jgi:hypothetical protein
MQQNGNISLVACHKEAAHSALYEVQKNSLGQKERNGIQSIHQQ